MKLRKKSALVVVMVASFLGNAANAIAAEVWGKTDGKLQMSLSASSSTNMTLTLRNTSRQDEMLSIGMMLSPSVSRTAKGKTEDLPTVHYQFPNAITLLIQNAAGKSRELSIKGPPGAGGIVEPLEIPLAPGATYSFATPLSQYIDVKADGPLPTGPVQITARYASKENHDKPNRRYWSGSLLSNTVTIQL